MVHIYSNTIKRPVKVGNKTVGTLENNKFIKSVNDSKHKLKYPPAWAIDADVFDKEIKPKVTEIIVLDKETGLKYHCSVKTFTRHSFRFNRGFADQYALPLQYWTVEGNGHKQLSLWGGVDAQ